MKYIYIYTKDKKDEEIKTNISHSDIQSIRRMNTQVKEKDINKEQRRWRYSLIMNSHIRVLIIICLNIF